VIVSSLIGVGVSYETVYAQSSNITAPAPVQSTKWTDFFASSKAFEDPDRPDSRAIHVNYESDNMIVFESQYSDLTWLAANYLKNDGFKIDNIVTYEEVIVYKHINYVVIMSKD
jgi:hypothetical protein